MIPTRALSQPPQIPSPMRWWAGLSGLPVVKDTWTRRDIITPRPRFRSIAQASTKPLQTRRTYPSFHPQPFLEDRLMAKPTEVEKLVSRLFSGNARARDEAAAKLADWLEGKQFTPEELQTIVAALMEAADGETDAVARESIFNALSSASMAYPGAEIDWSPIADSLAGLTPDCLEHALLALGFSGHAIYRDRIEPYLKHPDK